MYRGFIAGLCLIGFAVPLAAQTADEKKATLAYLTGLQTSEGAFRADANAKEPTLRATSSAVRAYKYFGGTLPNKEACAGFVKSCFDPKKGGFGDRPGMAPNVFTTAVGIMAVVHLGMPTEPYALGVAQYLDQNVKDFDEVRIAVAGLEAMGRPALSARKWIDLVQQTRNTDGTYGNAENKAPETGGRVVAYLRLGGKPRDPDAILAALNGGMLKSGGFGKTAEADLETTYRVMRAFHMLRTQPSRAEDLRKFVASCRNNDGGYGLMPGQPSTLGATYFASIILHWLDSK